MDATSREVLWGQFGAAIDVLEKRFARVRTRCRDRKLDPSGVMQFRDSAKKLDPLVR